MKFAMMGSGGVGGYFGGRLAAGGHDVTFIARGAHLAAIRADGLKIESGLGNATIHPAQATDDPGRPGPVDYVIIAVKLGDTEAAARAARPLVGPDSAVLSLQNGVVAEDILAGILGPEHVIGGMAQIACSIVRPGTIGHLGTMQRVVLGELGGGASPRVEALRDALAEAGVVAEISDDIERTIWEKFVFLVGLSATTTLMRTTIGPVREDPDSRQLLRGLMAETVAVARARGVALAGDYAEDRMGFVDGLPFEMTSSMSHDLNRGNPLEVAWLSGAVVRFGRELDIATPLNHTVYAALKPFSNGSGGR
jgi:2-dehydropantoate 2-reductase